MPEIQLQNLTKKYGNVEVLHGINLNMKDNEFTVLVGPSGCGKSTTLRMIAGLETVSSGEILINNKPVSHLDPKQRNLAMVFQDYALYPHMDVAKNMSFALKLQKIPKTEIEKKVRHVAQIVGLQNLLHRKPAELSGGQRQRVAMGRALVKDSPVFLFDEPLSNLDAKLRGQMRAELAMMSQKVKKNMVYVTHDQIEAMTLADQIVVMHDGHIQQNGTPQNLFLNPVNKFVAGFIGSPPMNFLEATINQKNDDMFLKGNGFNLKLPEKQANNIKKINQTQKDVIVGIRPSDLTFNKNAKNDQALELNVTVSEYVGAQSVLICQCGNQKVTVELKSETPVMLGQKLKFKVNKNAIHIFNKNNQNTIA